MKWQIAAIVFALAFVIAGAALADKYKHSEWKKLTGDVQIALQGADTDTINGLIRKIGEDDSKRAVEFLVAVGLQVTNPDVYTEIKSALASMTDKKALREIAKQVDKNRDVRVRIMLLEVLGEKGVDVRGQVPADHFGNLGREDDLEASLRDLPAHHVLRVRVEHRAGRADPRSGDSHSLARDDGGSRTVSEEPRRDQVGHRAIAALERQ